MLKVFDVQLEWDEANELCVLRFEDLELLVVDAVLAVDCRLAPHTTTVVRCHRESECAKAD